MPDLITRLRTDPEWARDVLDATYYDARQRWQRRWRDGRHPTWIHPTDSVPLAFDHAIQNLPESVPLDEVDATIQMLIDDFIIDQLADQKPWSPARLDRGAKRHNRAAITSIRHEDERAEAATLRRHMRRHARQAAYVLPRIRHQKLQLGLEMLQLGQPLRHIRAATGLRGPDLVAGYQRWLAILGIAA